VTAPHGTTSEKLAEHSGNGCRFIQASMARAEAEAIQIRGLSKSHLPTSQFNFAYLLNELAVPGKGDDSITVDRRQYGKVLFERYKSLS
jgi:hypothetical protein